MVFLQFPENGADNGLAEKFRPVGNFVPDTEIFDNFVFCIVKYECFPVLSPGCAGGRFFFMYGRFHK